MLRYIRPLFLFLGLLISLMLASPFGVSADSSSRTADTGAGDLFINLALGDCSGIMSSQVRERPVDIQLSALGGTDGPDLTTSAGRVVGLNMFENFPAQASDASLITQLDTVTSVENGYVWQGTISGQEGSSVTIMVTYDGGTDIVTGHIVSDEGTFSIARSTDGTHACLIEYDVDTMMSTDDVAAPLPPRSRSRAVLTPDDGSLIDVLILYTTAAKTEAGGEAAIQAIAQGAIDQANIIADNSSVTNRLWLVDAQEVTGFTRRSCSSGACHQDDLNDLRASGDGILDAAQTLRDSTHADIVYLIVAQNTNANPYTTGGVASIAAGTTAGNSNEAEAFALGTLGCTMGYCFAHEMGHVRGLMHDWYTDGAPSLFDYSTGYTDPQHEFRTVMSYSGNCTALGTSCRWIPYYSNPLVTFNGFATGVSSVTGGTGCTQNSTTPNAVNCKADSASSLNTTDPFIAAFRASKVTWTGAVDNDWSNASNWSFDQGVPGSTSVQNRVPLVYDDVVIPSGGAPVLSSGTVSVRELVIEDGGSVTMSGGTLNVLYNWDEQGTGQFNGTGGTVVFKSPLPQTLNMNANSTLPNVEIGDGGTQEVTLLSDVDIDGNLTIKNGAVLKGSDKTIEVSGDWTEEAAGFDKGSSTVVFDGAAQTVTKPTAITAMEENFSKADGKSCCNLGQNPTGWVADERFYSGDQAGFTHEGGSAVAFGSGESLISAAVNLSADVEYSISLDAKRVGSSFQVYIGQAQTVAGTLTNVMNENTTGSFETYTSDSFTVATSGTYYVRFVAGSSLVAIDNIKLEGTQSVAFHNATVDSGSSTTFSSPVAIAGDFQTNTGPSDADGRAILGANEMTVEGTVTNNGRIVQTKDLDTVSTEVSFGHIQNAAGDTNKYYGIDMTPTSASMGSTTVEIEGNDTCNPAGQNSVDNSINRCYHITPTTADAATIKFYYSESERNGQDASSMHAWHWTGSLWEMEPQDSTGMTDGFNWVSVTDVDQYSPFAVGVATPTAVELSSFEATAHSDGSVTIDWETASEVNHAGFNIYRLPDGTTYHVESGNHQFACPALKDTD